MSPLARPLLALACAALLHAACAQTVCSSNSLGNQQGIKIVLPLIYIPPSAGREVNYEIKDNCAARFMVLRAEVATVCDWASPPDVRIVARGRAVHVVRTGQLVNSAVLEVRQYCGWY